VFSFLNYKRQRTRKSQDKGNVVLCFILLTPIAEKHSYAALGGKTT
jgi:hypothetical protein